MTPDAATAKAWADLQGQIVQDRARYDWAAKHPALDGVGDALRHIGRVAAYGDMLDEMDRLLREISMAPTRWRWDEFRRAIKRDRDLYYEQATGHGDLSGHEAQEERAYGRVLAYDEVLAAMDRTEQESGR